MTTGQIISGTEIAKNIRSHLAGQVKQLKNNQVVPGLATIRIGDDPASEIYVNYKVKACAEIGFKSFSHNLPIDVNKEQLETLIHSLNNDDSVHGILVQLPLPKHLDSNTIIENIDPKKDVDGFHINNMGSLAINQAKLRPCTPKGVMTLLDSIPDYEITGKHAVMIGASNIVGRPMSLELLNRAATVTICHSKTQSLESIIKTADILIVAVGIPAFVPGSWIKPRAVVIDVGINRLADNKLCGDVFFQEAKSVASYITPVPGGVGPMTIATLMENTWYAYQQCQK